MQFCLYQTNAIIWQTLNMVNVSLGIRLSSCHL